VPSLVVIVLMDFPFPSDASDESKRLRQN
jgi:hypothetical protein